MINRRGFLRMLAKGAALFPVAILAKGTPSAAEMRLVRAKDLSMERADNIDIYLNGGKVSKCMSFYGASEPGIEVAGWARVCKNWPPLAGIDGEPLTVKHHGRIEWQYKNPVQAVERRIFMLSSERVYTMEIYLDGVEVVSDCRAFCGAVEPEVEVEGWADIIEDKRAQIEAGAVACELVTVKKYGRIEWRHKT